ncbi:hypothetical protein [Desulfobacter sp.]|uniref:hypothetical protein n=1 Tax=Desulfobacter sp. TaxID=2294 RepID=UPI003D12D3BA
MKTHNRLWWISCFLAVAFFMSATFGCASHKDFKRVEEMAQQALNQSAEAKTYASDSVQRSESAAESAAQSANEAKEAAEDAKKASARAEEMANKSEAIFNKLMKK